MNIHPTAQIHKTAEIHATANIGKFVTIGAFAVIGAEVEIGQGTTIDSHVVVHGPTKIGTNNRVYSFAVVGGDPQDISYEEDQDSRLIIGNDNQIREFSTINRGTEKQDGVTVIGSNNLFMAYTHIGHDCVIGDNVVLTNNSSLAGHVVVGDWAILGGFTLVKQFCRIGAHVYTGMGTQLNKDVPPFVIVADTPSRVRFVNSEGMRRRGVPLSSVNSIKGAFKVVYGKRTGTLSNSLKELNNAEMEFSGEEVKQFLDFFKNSKNGILL